VPDASSDAAFDAAFQPPSAQPSGRLGIFINRDFALLWVGQIVSNIGDFALSATLVLWIATRLAVSKPWAPLAVSGEFLALTVPVVLFGPLAGVFVDRWDKRRTMLTMDLARALLVGLLALLATPLGSDLPPAWTLVGVYSVVALSSICSQLFNPARLALIGDLAPPDQQARASSLMFMTVSLGVTIGPALAAPLYVAYGPVIALAFDALSFVVSFAALWALRAPKGAQSETTAGDVLGELASGLRYFFSHRGLRTLLIVTALTLAGASAINTLGIFFLTTNLQSPAAYFGLLSAATGTGVLIGSVCAVWIVPRLGPVRSFWISVLVVGGLIAIYARQTDFISAVAFLLLLGLPSAALNVAIGPLILAYTPRAMVGRAAAIFTPATSLAAALSAALAGYLASTLLGGFHLSLGGIEFGPYDTVYLLCGMLIIASGIYATSRMPGAHPGIAPRDGLEPS
jgi:MFS family permease